MHLNFHSFYALPVSFNATYYLKKKEERKKCLLPGKAAAFSSFFFFFFAAHSDSPAPPTLLPHCSGRPKRQKNVLWTVEKSLLQTQVSQCSATQEGGRRQGRGGGGRERVREG